MANKLTKCSKCQKELSMSVGVCSGCGTKRKPPQWVVAVLGGLGALVLLIAIASAFGPKKDKEAESGSAPAASSATPQPSKESAKVAVAPVDVTADELHEAYKENEIGADSKYRGKILRVSGKVAQIGKDILDNPFVEIATSNEFEGVHATFASEGALGSLKRGQKITVRCRGKGLAMGSPMLDDCAIE